MRDRAPPWFLVEGMLVRGALGPSEGGGVVYIPLLRKIPCELLLTVFRTGVVPANCIIAVTSSPDDPTASPRAIPSTLIALMSPPCLYWRLARLICCHRYSRQCRYHAEADVKGGAGGD